MSIICQVFTDVLLLLVVYGVYAYDLVGEGIYISPKLILLWSSN